MSIDGPKLESKKSKVYRWKEMKLNLCRVPIGVKSIIFLFSVVLKIGFWNVSEKLKISKGHSRDNGPNGDQCQKGTSNIALGFTTLIYCHLKLEQFLTLKSRKIDLFSRSFSHIKVKKRRKERKLESELDNLQNSNCLLQKELKEIYWVLCFHFNFFFSAQIA